MTFDEFTRSCGCFEPDVEYYMEKAWNAAIEAALNEVYGGWVVEVSSTRIAIERLKTPLEGSEIDRLPQG